MPSKDSVRCAYLRPDRRLTESMPERPWAGNTAEDGVVGRGKGSGRISGRERADGRGNVARNG